MNSNKKLPVTAIITLILLPFTLMAEYLEPESINLIDPPVDSVQKTLWRGFPVLVHRRNEHQLRSVEEAVTLTPNENQRYLSYQSIARTHGNEFASAIREFTENYIKNNNLYVSEKPEFGIYSLVSPILGCAVFKDKNGFVDPCNGVEFDFAGKVKNHKGYAHLRLMVPPHKIVEDQLVFIEDYQAKQVVDFTPDILQMKLSAIDKALYAIDWEKKGILARIIQETPEVIIQRNSAGTNLVQMAAYHDKTLDYLLEFTELNINHVNDAGYTALMFAVWNNKLENAEKLIKYGATPQSYFYKEAYVPDLYEFMVRDFLYPEETASQIYEKLLKIEKDSQLN